MSKYIILFLMAMVFLSCASSSTTVTKLVIEGVVEKNAPLDYNKGSGWLSDDAFKITAKGYPSFGASENSKRDSSYDAAFSLAQAKVAYHFSRETSQEIDEKEVHNIISNYGNIIQAQFVDDKYVDMVIVVEYDGLRNILRSGEIDELIR